MATLEGFLNSIVSEADPSSTWLVLADWLEDQDDPRGELVRLLHQPGYARTSEERDARLRQLLDCVPPLFENPLNAHFVWVPPGTFWMGGGGGECGDRQVTIEQGFALGVFPVTQGQWQAIMGDNPSRFSRSGEGHDAVKDISDEELSQFPVECVSWDDTQEFLEKLNAQNSGPEYLYRLPGEAEWEYACREGATSREACSFHFYLDQPSNALSSIQANFDGQYPDGSASKGPYLGRPTKVGSYRPNRLGLYDLHGNVWEWCQDLHEEGGPRRVIRGGGWGNYGQYCRAAFRSRDSPENRSTSLGFRLARVPVQPR